MANQAQGIVEENKMADRIDVLHNTVENVVFPEKLDAIVSEWMGYCLFYESMLPSVIQCRDKWLKDDGIILPSSATLYIAPFSDCDYDNRLDFWSEIKSVYKLSMESMKPYARKCIARHVHVNSIPPESVQARAEKVCYLDLHTVQSEDLQNIQSNFTFRCFGCTHVHGFVTWFDVEFPESITLSTSPYEEETHWSQTMLYLEDKCMVTQDTVIKGSISIRPHKGAPRFLDITLSYQFDDGPRKTRTFFMNDCFV